MRAVNGGAVHGCTAAVPKSNKQRFTRTGDTCLVPQAPNPGSGSSSILKGTKSVSSVGNSTQHSTREQEL